MGLEAWEAQYWHACESILGHMDASLEDWMGAADAAAPRQLLDEAAAALVAAVKLRVEAARDGVKELKKAERDRLHAAEVMEPERQAELFRNRYDEIWIEACPACACRAFATGEQTGEEISEEPDEYAVWEIVEREFVARSSVAHLRTLSERKRPARRRRDRLHPQRSAGSGDGVRADYGND